MNIPDVFVGEIMASDEPGFACSKAKLVDEGLIHLRPFNISNCGALFFKELYHVPIDQAPTGKRRLEPGDLLFNNTNSVELVGKAALVEESIEAGYSNHLTRIRVNQEKVYPLFMLYWLRWMRGTGYFSAHATQWVSQAAFKSSELRRLKMPLPELPEQRRIVDILSRAESIVRLRREAEKKAAELIPALFIDMFGDPATNSKGWPIGLLGDVGSLDRGKSRHRPRDAKELYGGQYPFIQTGDVSNSGGWISKYSSTYSDFGLAQSKLWPAGTLCITIAANIARTGVLQFDACFPDSVVGFLPGGAVKTEYIKAWLGFLQPTLEANAPQAAQKNINLEVLRNLPIPLPPLELQNLFEARCLETLSIRVQQSLGLTKAEEAFNALLSRAFSSTGSTS